MQERAENILPLRIFDLKHYFIFPNPPFSLFRLDCFVFIRSLFKKYCITEKKISNDKPAHRKPKKGYLVNRV